jgi:carboxypeptidase C (cathepsin A)
VAGVLTPYLCIASLTFLSTVTREILDRNSDGFINFRGMVVGNPWVDPGSNMMTQFGALYSHGLVAKPWYDKFLRLCTAEDAYDPSEECEKIMDFINDNIGDEINPYGLDYPVCINHDTPAATTNESSTDLMRRLKSPSSQVIYLLKKKTRRKAGPPFLPSWDDYKPCEERNFAKYMNREDVQAALHVKKSAVWGPCNDVINELYSNEDVMTPVVNWYRDLVRDGVKGLHDLDLMVLSGDDDSICALEGTQDWIFDLGVQPKEGAGLWNPWFVKERVAGYRTEFDLGKRTNATFALVTVHGCGHEIPAYLPMEGLQVFKNYLRGKW